MGAWLPPLGFAPSIGAVQWPSYVGPGIEGFGPWLGPPPLVVVVAVVVVIIVVVIGVIGSRMMIDGGTCCCPRCLLLQLLFPCMRSSCLLLS